MTTFGLLTFSLILMSLLCFIISIWLIPVNKKVISFDLRLYVGFFSVLTYLVTSFIWMSLPNLLNSIYYSLIVLSLGVAVSVFSFMIAWITHISNKTIDHTYFFSLWFSGLLAAFLATKIYTFVIGLVVVGLLIYGAFYLVRRFHLVSSIRTIVVTVDSLESIDYVKRLLTVLNASIISSDIARKGHYQFTCKYRLATLGQHIFMRYILNSDRLDDVVINESA
jgi:hypothetical protein